MKVVSLLPSATEIASIVGAEKYLCGRSHECNYPPAVCRLPILTGAVNKFENSKQMHEAVTETLARGEGLYYVDQELLRSLRPDVILTQSVCAVCSVDFQMVQKMARELDPVPVVVDLNPQSLEDVLADCVVVGEKVGLVDGAKEAVVALRSRVQKAVEFAQRNVDGGKRQEVAFMEWVDPIFIGGHWTPQIIEMAGGSHSLNPPKNGDGAGKSYVVEPDKLLASDPDWVILCPCGLNIEETRRELKSVKNTEWWQSLRAVKEQRVVLVDGDQMFNRPGPRLVEGLEWLVGLLHNQPEMMPNNFPWEWEHTTTE